MTPLILVIDGLERIAADVIEDLPRAVLISLFTWRRANPDDLLPSNNKYGWWGDTYPQIDNDRIGSRLWLLSRAKLTAQTILQAKEYAEEALAWLLSDGVVSSITVAAERQGLSALALDITIVRGGQSALTIRFADVWNYINAV